MCFFLFQVEFAPTFEEQPMYEQWSWDQNPVYLTCIATGIPNATITWWVRDREINREIIDRNMEVSCPIKNLSWSFCLAMLKYGYSVLFVIKGLKVC